MSATRQKVIQMLGRFGLKTEGIDGDYQLGTGVDNYFDAWLPKGKTWKASGCHVICVSGDDANTASEFYGWCIEDLSDGVDNNCDQPDCDTCNGY